MNVHTEYLMLAVLALGSLRTFAGVLGQNSLGVEELPLAMMGLQRSQGLPLISVKTTPPPPHHVLLNSSSMPLSPSP